MFGFAAFALAKPKLGSMLPSEGWEFAFHVVQPGELSETETAGSLDVPVVPRRACAAGV
jgi:hypothetical protein